MKKIAILMAIVLLLYGWISIPWEISHGQSDLPVMGEAEMMENASEDEELSEYYENYPKEESGNADEATGPEEGNDVLDQEAADLEEMIQEEEFDSVENQQGTVPEGNQAGAPIQEGEQLFLSNPMIEQGALENPQLFLRMKNGNRNPINNTLFPWFHIENHSGQALSLEKLTIRYYYTIDGEKAQNFFSDWSTIGSGNVTGRFVKMEQPWEGADYYLEIGFLGDAGELAPGQPLEIQTRIAKQDWSDYQQTNDYSFFQSANEYEEWHQVTVHYDGMLSWGNPGNEIEPEPIPTEPELVLKMFNADRSEITNTIFIRYELENTGALPVALKDVGIQYFYTIDGKKPQNYFIDWSTVGAAYVTGFFTELEEPLIGGDYLFQIGFKEEAGILAPGQKIEVHARIGKHDWSNFNQGNDYSFHPHATDYVHWNQVILLLNGEAAGGNPSEPAPPPEPQDPLLPLVIQLYNGNRTEHNNTLFPWFRVYNNGTEPIALEEVRIRYFFTINGQKPLTYFVDWSSIGAGNVEGSFGQFSKPRSGGDHYFEIGFKAGAGWLAPGEYAEVHTRVAKNDWSNFIQSDDFSFNSSAHTFVNWTKVNGYYQGYFVWGEADFFDIPEALSSQATETTVLLTWEPVASASLYEVEADGQVFYVGESTSYLHSSLLPGTDHIYRVRAKTTTVTGNWSEPLAVCTIPGIPQNIVTLGTSQSITLNWDPVRGAEAYEVEIYGIPMEAGENTFYTHSDLNPNTQTTYRVRAKNQSGVGQWSSVVAQATLPGTPTGLTGQAKAFSAEITWNPTAGATAYDLEIDGQVIENLYETRYQHTQLQPNRQYTYRVKAKNQLGESQWSGTFILQTLLETPVNLRGTSLADQIVVAWDGVAEATGYELERNGERIDTGMQTTYTHSGLQQNTSHTYRVRARNGAVFSEWSQPLTKTTLLSGQIQLTLQEESTRIIISWNAVPGALGYEIEADGVPVNNGLNTSYVHEGLQPNTVHTYRVRVHGQGGAAPWSEPVTGRTIFNTPQNLRAMPNSDRIIVGWDPVEGATGYDLFVDGSVIDVGSATSFVHYRLEPYTWHFYRVRAKAAGVVGEWSGAITAVTLIGTPMNLEAIPAGNQITLRWHPVAHATHYEIQANGSILQTVTGNEFIHLDLGPNQTMTYRVRAFRADNGLIRQSTGAWSTPVEATTLQGAPTNFQATASTTEITLTWDGMAGVNTYDLEVDGRLVEGITGESYHVQGLTPNTYHSFRIRAGYEQVVSEWSDLLEKNTVPELTLQIGQDNLFHFVVVAPPKAGQDNLTITVSYHPDEVEVLDLSANTPGIQLEVGSLPGTQITILSFIPGKIVYQAEGVAKTVVNTIQFLSKTNELTKITYVIE